MREIKFRGKRFDNNHDNWVCGHLHVIDTCGEGFTGKAIQQQSGSSRPYSVRVQDGSVGQYTGLKDKNGREIYEGDILRFEHAIGWSNEIQCVTADRWSWGTEEYAFWEMVDRKYIFEVIGNIHENPELL